MLIPTRVSAVTSMWRLFYIPSQRKEVCLAVKQSRPKTPPLPTGVSDIVFADNEKTPEADVESSFPVRS